MKFKAEAIYPFAVSDGVGATSFPPTRSVQSPNTSVDFNDATNCHWLSGVCKATRSDGGSADS